MSRLGLIVATFGYVGYFPIAPGTAGSLAALALYAIVRWVQRPVFETAVMITIFIAGVWAATRAEQVLGVEDPGPVVIDEVLGMLLTLSKRILESDRALRRERNVNRNALIGNEARGKTIGIVGIGNVGRRIAELCNGLLHMKVIACDPYLTAEEIAERGAEKVELDDLLRRSDFVSISCPLDAGSRGMIGARQFALMQPHAFFITTARGFISGVSPARARS